MHTLAATQRWDEATGLVRPLQGLGAAHPCGSVRPRSADATLRIIIIDESPVRAAILKEGLCAAGHVDVLHFADRADLLARIYAVDDAGIVVIPTTSTGLIPPSKRGFRTRSSSPHREGSS